MRVTVFGGSRPTPEHYEQAQRLGTLLGQAGHTVLTGGYVGVMEATSRGAKEAGAHVIGITCDEIERWRKLPPNEYVVEELRYATLRERLYALIELSDAAIAMPGGIGTLAEIAMVWNHLAIQSLSPRPLILVGDGWRATFESFFKHLGFYVNEADQRWLLLAKDVDEAVEILSRPL